MSLDQLRLEGEDLEYYLKMQKSFLMVRIHSELQQFQQDAHLHGAEGTEAYEHIIDVLYNVLTIEERCLEDLKNVTENP